MEYAHSLQKTSTESFGGIPFSWLVRFFMLPRLQVQLLKFSAQLETHLVVQSFSPCQLVITGPCYQAVAHDQT